MKISRVLVDERYMINAIYGARLSYGSGDAMDSTIGKRIAIGPNDEKLCRKLIKADSGHAKFLRAIPVSCVVHATSIWWRQFDQHKVGMQAMGRDIFDYDQSDTTTQSESVMHRKKANRFAVDDFDHDPTDMLFLQSLDALNIAWESYNESDSNRRGPLWERVVKLIPSSFIYEKQLTVNYHVLRGIYSQRRNHRWGEWKVFLDWIDTLPCSWLASDEL